MMSPDAFHLVIECSLLSSKNISPWISAEPFSNTEELYLYKCRLCYFIPPVKNVPPE